MKDINRIKVVLVEKNCKWVVEAIGKRHLRFPGGI